MHVTPPPPLIEPPTTVTNPTTAVDARASAGGADEEEDRGTRPGLLVFLAILLVIVLGLAAYLLPKMFASPTDQVQVPRLAGLTRAQARAKLGRRRPAGRHASTTRDSTEVARQPGHRPGPGRPTSSSTRARPSTFTLSRRQAPDEGALRRRAAEERGAVGVAGRALNPVFQLVDSDQPKGTVVRPTHPPASKVPATPTVTVYISAGPQKVPDVVGLTQAEAEQMLKDRGFTPRSSPDNSSTETEGHGHRAEPAAGADPAAGLDGRSSTVSTYEPELTADVASPTSEPTSPPTSLPTSPPT